MFAPLILTLVLLSRLTLARSAHATAVAAHRQACPKVIALMAVHITSECNALPSLVGSWSPTTPLHRSGAKATVQRPVSQMRHNPYTGAQISNRCTHSDRKYFANAM